MYRRFVKPALDFFFAFVGLLLLSPLILVITVFLAISNNGKPFFYQNRPGKGEHIFKIVKFKTMTDARDTKGNLAVRRSGGFAAIAMVAPDATMNSRLLANDARPLGAGVSKVT
jgi:lipopolysaccharide/colanic/teichoic acid biosynthesis glycosyltransferase